MELHESKVARALSRDDAFDVDIYRFAQILFAMLTGITGVLPRNTRLRQEWARLRTPDKATTKAAQLQAERFSVDSVSLPVGTRLGPYTIEAELGRGRHGKVYAAHDAQLNRVALKVRPAKMPPTQEAFALQQLNHPHVCAYYGSGEENGLSFLALEYLDGQLLVERLRLEPLPVDEALEYARQLADALNALHRAGIVHRDLWPSHIMLTESGVKLFDFSKARDAGTPKRRQQAEHERRIAARAAKKAARQERLAAKAHAQRLKAKKRQP